MDNKYERLLEWKQMVAREVTLEIGISKNNCANLDKKYEKQLEWKQSNTMTCIWYRKMFQSIRVHTCVDKY